VETAKTMKLIEYYAAAEGCESVEQYAPAYSKIKSYYSVPLAKEPKKEEKKKEEPEEPEVNENMGFGLFD
jgi:hypothetical protein